MGYFFDYLTGGNPKVAAGSIYNVHNLTGGNFAESFMIRWNSLVGVLVNAPILPKTATLAKRVLNKELKNYTDLALFSLSMEAAPKNISYYETERVFRHKIEKYLRQKNIPEFYITGDNRSLLEKSINEMLPMYSQSLKMKSAYASDYEEREYRQSQFYSNQETIKTGDFGNSFPKINVNLTKILICLVCIVFVYFYFTRENTFSSNEKKQTTTTKEYTKNNSSLPLNGSDLIPPLEEPHYTVAKPPVIEVDQSNNSPLTNISPDEQFSQALQKEKIKDYVGAAEIYFSLGQQGHILSCRNLALLYFSGKGVPKDKKIAFDWFYRAADLGDPYSQGSIGWMYETGTGITKDLKQALYWYQLAAQNNNSKAQIALGDLYKTGKGVNKNIELARYWYMKAHSLGEKSALNKLNNL